MQHLTILLDWVSTHHSQLLALLFGAAGLSVTLEVLLTKFKVESKKIAFVLLHVFSALTALSAFGLGDSGKQAGGVYASLVIVASVWHRFVISDANTKYVSPFLGWLSSQKDPVPSTAAPSITAATGTTSTVTSSIPVGNTTVTMVGSTAGDAKPFTLDQPVGGK